MIQGYRLQENAAFFDTEFEVISESSTLSQTGQEDTQNHTRLRESISRFLFPASL